MLSRKIGDVAPDQYDWKEQFDLPTTDQFVFLDVGKVRGLAIYAAEIETENERLLDLLRQVLEWRALDGDGISDPLRETIQVELTEATIRKTAYGWSK